MKNHAKDLIAVDFFTVPTATFRILFVLVVLSHDRRRLVHFNVTEHPTAGWTARQLVEACELEETPGHLIRDRDQVYGEQFSRQARALNIREAVITPRSPWQNAYAERVIGSIRQECVLRQNLARIARELQDLSTRLEVRALESGWRWATASSDVGLARFAMEEGKRQAGARPVPRVRW